MTSSARRVYTVRYPSTDHRGQHFLQRAIAEALRPLIARWFKTRRVKAFTGADQFLYWVEGDPTRRVAPDVYVLPKVDPESAPSSWQLWEVGPPSFALKSSRATWARTTKTRRRSTPRWERRSW